MTPALAGAAVGEGLRIGQAVVAGANAPQAYWRQELRPGPKGKERLVTVSRGVTPTAAGLAVAALAVGLTVAAVKGVTLGSLTKSPPEEPPWWAVVSPVGAALWGLTR